MPKFLDKIQFIDSSGELVTIDSLDYSDSPVAGQFVTSVSETDGVISVTRRGINSDDGVVLTSNTDQSINGNKTFSNNTKVKSTTAKDEDPTSIIWKGYDIVDSNNAKYGGIQSGIGNGSNYTMIQTFPKSGGDKSVLLQTTGSSTDSNFECVFRPGSKGDINLGNNEYRWKDLYLKNAYIGSYPQGYSIQGLIVSTSSTDIIFAPGSSNVIPEQDKEYNIGSNYRKWKNGYFEKMFVSMNPDNDQSNPDPSFMGNVRGSYLIYTGTDTGTVFTGYMSGVNIDINNIFLEIWVADGSSAQKYAEEIIRVNITGSATPSLRNKLRTPLAEGYKVAAPNTGVGFYVTPEEGFYISKIYAVINK